MDEQDRYYTPGEREKFIGDVVQELTQTLSDDLPASVTIHRVYTAEQEPKSRLRVENAYEPALFRELMRIMAKTDPSYLEAQSNGRAYKTLDAS